MTSEALNTPPRTGVRRLAAALAVALICCTAVGSGSSAQAAKQPPACSLVPQLRDVSITQGVGAYTPLVRGKETLVRAYLSKPACAASGNIIELTGGTLGVTAGTAAAVTIQAPTPRPTSPFPQLAAATSAPLVDSTADPLWVVPGSVLAPTTTSARFTATFRFTITYQTRTSSTAAPVPGSVTFASRTGTTTPITATVEKRTNALRVLVVPMGDASNAFASQYTASGDAALQAAMLTVSRIYPVPEGVGSLTGTSGGLRYSVSPGMLDLRGLLGTDGRFCGTGGSNGNFNAIKASLGQFLQSWNAANGGANQADRVLGVVDAAISNGSAQGCAEGMAAVNSTEAWIRAVPELPGAPSQSGFVAALELGHTFGLVLSGPDPTPDRDDLFSRYHSPNVYADPLRRNRSYNTRLRSVLVDDRTAMTYIAAANNNNTLLEQLDWAYLICRLGGATSTECPAPAVPVGSGAGVAAGPRFVLSGVSDGTVSGTHVLESFFSTDMLPTPPDAASPYRLVYRSGATILANLGLPVQTEDSAHSHDEDGPAAPALALFSGAFEFQTAATRIEIWNGNPGTGVLLYSRDRTAAPVLGAVNVTDGAGGSANFTNDVDNLDIAPALSADGQWIAWSSFPPAGGPTTSVIRVAPADDVTQQVSLSDGGGDIASTDPAWCADGIRLAYADPGTGGLWTVSIETVGSVASFGTPALIYDATLPGNFVASHPTWSPDCAQLAFEADEDIWRIDADGNNVVALTNDDSSHDPSWSPDPTDNRIAFVVRGSTALNGDAIATYASFVTPGPEEPIVVQAHGGNHFVVTNATDGNDGTCDADCSLREAIVATNASPNIASTPDEIQFAIPGAGPHTIPLTGPLPIIAEAVFIEGISQPGWSGTPLIEIDGTAADPGSVGVDGLTFGTTADVSRVRGLAITGFSGDGIRVFADDVLIAFSYIGVAPDGTTAKGNGKIGVQVIGAERAIIGINSGVGGKNVISANGQHGVSINGGSALDPVEGTKIGGNLIGTDESGTVAMGNAAYGVFLNAFAQGTLVGGTVAQERNTISANTFGIVLADGADLNTIQGNRIGTDSAGVADLGNSGGGIEIIDAAGTMIGGATAGAGNVISGNGDATNGAPGIHIEGSQATGTQVVGNLIGVSATGSPLGNSTNGIEIGFAASQNRIGFTGANQGNTIAHNGEDGILVADGTGNTFRRNAIHDNGGLGIDLGADGVTENDLDDPDTGANDLTNFPVITSAVAIGTDATVDGTINSLPGSTQTIDFYVSSSCDASGNGEGATWVGFTVVTLDGGGDASFTVPLNGVAAGMILTATAAEGLSNSSSEFSDCFIVTGPETGTFTVNTTDDTDDGLCGTVHCSLREAINRANATAGFDTIEFDIPGGGTHTIAVTSPLPAVTQAATIDGTSQPGYAGTPLVVIDGAGAGSGASGLVLGSAPIAGGSVIQGLAVIGFDDWGIEVLGSSDQILNNYIGTPDGTSTDPNFNGVLVASTADHTEVRGNVISGNVGVGLRLVGDESQVHGNKVGTTAPGDFDLANSGAGIVVQAGANQRIGTDTPGDGNLISGNGGPGILVSGTVSIQGNRIGTDQGGTVAIANGAGGIEVAGGNAGIGGSVPGMGNLISGNLFDGVVVHTTGEASIEANFIGTNAAGTAAIPNSRHGVNVAGGGAANLIGSGASRNVISGNGAYGVAIADTPGIGILTSLHGNYIGTNANGTSAVPNVAGGVAVTDSIAVLIGQDTSGNLISGNGGPGIVVSGTSTDVEIAGNVIGLNFSSDVPISNGGGGIHVSDPAGGTLIGGDTDVTPGLGNIIAGNVGAGIVLDGSDGNVVQGNVIGTNSEETDLGNGGAGVSIINGGQGNRIGAVQSGTSIPDQPANVIAFNGGNGVEVVSGATDALDNEIHSNEIFDNALLGIDLEADGVTPNDPGDPDTGANDLINFADLIEASSDGGTTTGTITTTMAEDALIIIHQLFVSSECDPSGNGEGARYLLTIDTASDATGFSEAPFSIPEDLDGLWLTALTSDNIGRTSEFSECFQVSAGGESGEIHLLDPTAPLGPTAFVVAGRDPSWQAGSLLYTTADEIHRILPDGTGDLAITTGFTDAEPSGAPNLTAFVRSQGGDDEIWLLRDGSTVEVTASDDAPEDLRLDLYYVCGGQSMPIAVGLEPAATAGTSATFQSNYDPSLSCAGGTIEVALTDGFLRTTTPPGEGQPVASDPKPPIASTYGPPLGSTYLTSDVIALHGSGEDADDGSLAGASLRWFIRPAASACCGTEVGTGSSVDVDASGFAPGDYIVTLIVVDGDGEIDSAESLIHILADTDHDGFSDTEETGGCLGAGAATDGSTPSADADGDGLPNASDPEPCVKASLYNVSVGFNPVTFDLSSTGTITIKITASQVDLRRVIPSSVQITSAAGASISIPTTKWSASATTATAKFDRVPLTRLLREHGVTSAALPIVVTGSSNTNPTWSFSGQAIVTVKP